MLIDSRQQKQLILKNFLEICAFDGWNQEVLLKALEKSNIEEKFVNIIFPNGCLDVAEFYIEEQNIATADLIKEIPDFNANKIRDKITILLNKRFAVEKNNQLALQRLINFYLDPKNLTSFNLGPRPLSSALKACYKIADFMWFEINDKSTDFNFYTKRLTLAKIILRSVLVFVKDDSKDFTKTTRFIDSQIAKVMKFEKRKAQVKNFVNEFFLNKDNDAKSFRPKSPKDLIRGLPFIRLIKFKK